MFHADLEMLQCSMMSMAAWTDEPSLGRRWVWSETGWRLRQETIQLEKAKKLREAMRTLLDEEAKTLVKTRLEVQKSPLRV